MKSILLNSERDKKYCQTYISKQPADGSKIVTIKDASASLSDRQMRTRWMWATEVAKSGIGSDDIKKDVDTRAKWMFARPILLRDDEVFPVVYQGFLNTIEGSVNYSRYCRDFARDYISISKMFNKYQTAEYLTEFQRYWLDKGVDLTDPALQGVDLTIYDKVA